MLTVVTGIVKRIKGTGFCKLWPGIKEEQWVTNQKMQSLNLENSWDGQFERWHVGDSKFNQRDSQEGRRADGSGDGTSHVSFVSRRMKGVMQLYGGGRGG